MVASLPVPIVSVVVEFGSAAGFGSIPAVINRDDVLVQVLSGMAGTNIPVAGLQRRLARLGFDEPIRCVEADAQDYACGSGASR